MNNTIFFIGVIFALFLSGQLFAQTGVVISETANEIPDASAILDIKSTNKGILIPRVQLNNVTTEEPITNPADGLLIFNETGSEMHGFYYWDGTANRWRAGNNLQEQDNNVFQLDGRLKDKSGFIMPVGTVLPFAGESNKIPEGWLLCDGSTLNKYDNPEYSDLYDIIGSVWGGASGADFKIPDFRDRFLKGQNTDNVADIGGTADGSHTHTTNSQLGSISLSHSHTVNSHKHTSPVGIFPAGDQLYLSKDNGGGVQSINSAYHYNLGEGSTYVSNAEMYQTSASSPGTNGKLSNYDASHSHGTITQIDGTDNLPPYSTVNYIIKY